MEQFEAFRKSPSPDRLLELLRAHQDLVYTVCVQVLRHAQDAEDATQAALLKIAAGAGELREARAFKSWLYRVAFHTAVDHRRQRESRRRLHEERSPMIDRPLTPAAFDALHGALADLPDADRLLLAEHYFEKVPLEELGRRSGVSAVAVWKRVEKAKERLKRALLVAGFALGLAQVTQALEAVAPTAAPTGLVGPSLMSKAAAVAAAGGAAVGTKSSAGVLAWIAFLLLLGIGGGAMWFVSGEPSGPQKPSSPTDSRGTSNDRTITPVAKEAASPSEAPSLLKCRGLVARLVTRLRINEARHLAWAISEVQDGRMPGIEEFVREYTKAAGDQLVPFSRKLLAESESDTVRILLAIVLGRSRDPEAMEVLSGLCAEGSSVRVRAAALYSASLTGTPEGLALLRSTWKQAKKEGGSLVTTLVAAIGLQGAAGLEWLLEEFKDPNLSKILTYQGAPWSFSLGREDCLALVRGPGAFDALRRVHESDPDPKLRLGAARGMLANLDADHLDYATELITGTEYAQRSLLVLALHGVPKSPTRTELVDRILQSTAYPSGDLELDRSLVRLAQLASPQGTRAFLDRFLIVAPTSKDEQLFWNVGYMYLAAAAVPEAQARIKELMNSAGFSPEQEGLLHGWGLHGATPETLAALSGPVLDLMKTSKPESDAFSTCLRPLLLCGLDERIISAALQEVNDRQTQAQGRTRILWELIKATGGSGVIKDKEITVPQTYLVSAADHATDPISLFCAVQALGSSGTDALARWRIPLAAWIGRDMKWVTQADSAFSSVAPGIIGEYYARFGTVDDATWLKDLPDRFPYPALWKEDKRSYLKMALKEESLRAIDAIRLRN